VTVKNKKTRHKTYKSDEENKMDGVESADDVVPRQQPPQQPPQQQ
jgi:hypothetical protein